jgi:hypothetical protein
VRPSGPIPHLLGHRFGPDRSEHRLDLVGEPVGVLPGAAVEHDQRLLEAGGRVVAPPGPEAPHRSHHLIGDLVAGFAAGIGPGLEQLLEIGPFAESGGFVLLGALLVFTFGFIAVAVVLRKAAVDARNDMLERLERLPADALIDGVPRHEWQAKLRTMVAWPISYPRPNQLLAMAALALLALIFFRIGVLYLLLLAWKTVRTLGRAEAPA